MTDPKFTIEGGHGRDLRVSHQRLTRGWFLVLVAVISIACSILLLFAPVREPFYFLMPGFYWIATGWLVGGVSAAAALKILKRPLLDLIPQKTTRRALVFLSAIVTVIAGALWALILLFLAFSASVNQYVKVSAEDGQSVIIRHETLDYGQLTVYVQQSIFSYDSGTRVRVPTEEMYLRPERDSILGHCTLEPGGEGLRLTCGSFVIDLPGAAQ